jgi:hypothetical protein
MRSTYKYLLVVVVLLALELGAVRIAPAITNGQPDGDQHPYVGSVHFPLSEIGGQCAAVAVSPTVVVTAAHCADYSPEPVTVTFDPQWTSVTATWYSGTLYTHPDWCIACEPGLSRFDTHDVAVIVLDTPATLDSYALLPTLGLVDTLPMRTSLTVVGYGIHGWLTGEGNPFGNPDVDFTRYYALTELVTSNNLQSNEYLKLTANPAQGKGGVCFGDSGGPALLGNMVLGITSYVPDINCTGVTYSNRLDLAYALEFIGSYM